MRTAICMHVCLYTGLYTCMRTLVVAKHERHSSNGGSPQVSLKGPNCLFSPLLWLPLHFHLQGLISSPFALQQDL